MLQSILVPLTGFATDNAALDMAYRAGRLFDSHIECLWVRPAPAHFTAGAVESRFVNEASAALFAADDELRTAAARIAFAEFCEKSRIPLANEPPAAKGMSAALRETTGDAVEMTIAQSRIHDLVVLARAPSASHLSTRGIGSVLVGSGRPVLLASDGLHENFARTIAIAWKDTPEAARALSMSMPFLEKAEKIVVFSVLEGGAKHSAAGDSADRIATTLRWNGLKAEAHSIPSAGQTAPEAVLSATRICGADLLVMGGYGHGRARELAFGGFTQHMLAACPLPLLMVH